MDLIYDFLLSVVDIFNEMSPYLLLGFLIAGIMHSFVPDGWYKRFLAGGTLRSVVNAALLGIPLPLCSCGVIPTAMSLRKEGASHGAVVSFLIATPQTGVDSIFATYSLMGLPFAIVRPIAALVTAVLGGAFVGANVHEQVHEHKEECCCCCHDSRNVQEAPQLTMTQRTMAAMKYAFVEMMGDIGKWLFVGLIIAGMITTFVPDEWFAAFKDDSLMSMILVLCISIPMYVCATGSIPIAVALMMKGLTPGAALVMLMAGPAANAASILVINKVMGRKTLVLYLIAIVTGALAFGFGIDCLLPREWFTDALVEMKACCHEEAGWLSWGCSALLLMMLLNVLRMRLFHHEEHCCSCGHHHERNACLVLLAAAMLLVGCGNDMKDDEAVRLRVESIYTQVLATYLDTDVDEAQPLDKDQFLSRELKGLLDKADEISEATNEPIIDWDIWISAQDWQGLALGEVKVLSCDKGEARVEVAITNMGNLETITLEMVLEDDEWQIGDFIEAKGMSLHAMLNQLITDTEQ